MDRNKHLLVSSILFTTLLILWPVFMAVSQPEGEKAQVFDWIIRNKSLFKLQFFFAFLLIPSIIYLMVSQLNMSCEKISFSHIAGFIFLAGFFTMNTISYGSQVIVVPKLVEAGNHELAAVFYFGFPSSFTYFLNQTGYFFWAVGTLFLFIGFLRKKGKMQTLSIIYLISAVLTFVAYAGLLVENPLLNAMTTLSGIVLLPVGIISLWWSFKKQVRCGKEEAGSSKQEIRS